MIPRGFPGVKGRRKRRKCLEVALRKHTGWKLNFRFWTGVAEIFVAIQVAPFMASSFIFLVRFAHRNWSHVIDGYFVQPRIFVNGLIHVEPCYISAGNQNKINSSWTFALNLILMYTSHSKFPQIWTVEATNGASCTESQIWWLWLCTNKC
jgi:hypothetical protein